MTNKPKYNVYLYFTTCTLAEAITEINIMLEQAGYPLISENNYVNCQPSDHGEDWFDDYDFTFKTEIQDDKNTINKKLSDVCMSFDINND